jgi:hypothetical protein
MLVPKSETAQTIVIVSEQRGDFQSSRRRRRAAKTIEGLAFVIWLLKCRVHKLFHAGSIITSSM